MDDSVSSCVGIDVSKGNLDVHLLSERRTLKLPNTPAGHAQLLAQLPAPGTCRVVVEATGGYERRLVGELVAGGHFISVVNPRQVRDFAKAHGILAKTDRIDARVIARFGRDVRPRPVAQTSEKQEQLERTPQRQTLHSRWTQNASLHPLHGRSVRLDS